MLRGLAVPAHALVTGASRGIGLAIVRGLLDRGDVARVVAVSRTAEVEPALADLAATHGERLRRISADLAREGDIAALTQHAERLHLVFNAAGVLQEGVRHERGDGGADASQGRPLQPEKSLSSVDAASLQRVFALNAFAPILLARALLPRLPRDAPCMFASLSARVGSIGDNRLGGWYAYRASKAAQNQLLRTLAIEWKRALPRATVLLLHPGTVDTALSRPFQANVPAEKLFTPERAAEQLLDLVTHATPEQSGRFYAWDGSEIPW
jgi:NAD(P)-dependent dehydrogenase (short-subunit alcohol dehydrogenase family)